MEFIIETQEFGLELKDETNKTVLILEKIPGMKKIPFGNEYTAYTVGNIIASDKENLRNILQSLINYCTEKDIAVVYHIYISKGYKLSKVKETKEVYMGLGFNLTNSSLWYIP